MTGQTTLETARLILRPYSDADIPELLPLVGSREVAATTLRIAHPYTEQDARGFLRLAQEPGKIWLAITLRADGRQIGGIGLRVEEQHRHAELGYWLGVPCWGKGYATEAAREMVRARLRRSESASRLRFTFQAQPRVWAHLDKAWHAPRGLST
jgi:[ribosomal protein S5]-alanine N-acetyltransferase